MTPLHHHHYPDQEHVRHCVIFHQHEDREPGSYAEGYHDHSHPYYHPCTDLECIFKQVEVEHNS